MTTLLSFTVGLAALVAGAGHWRIGRREGLMSLGHCAAYVPWRAERLRTGP